MPSITYQLDKGVTMHSAQRSPNRSWSLRLRAALLLLAVLALLLLAAYGGLRLLIGPATALLATRTLLIGGGLLVVAALLLQEHLFLKPLAALRRELGALAEQREPWVRLQPPQGDALVALARTINSALDAQIVAYVQQGHQEQRALTLDDDVQARRDFIASVSHELRTPLTPIGGFVDMLLMGVGGTLTIDQQVYLTTIKANTTRLIALVDDLLEMGRIEAGRVQLDRTALDLRQLVEAIVAALRDELEQRRQTLRIALPALPLLKGDSRRVEQVLARLLSNASKYTYPGGTIVVGAAARADGLVEIRVTDTGIGLSDDQQQQLFTPFYRAESPLRDEVGGTGLGLCIARALVELHGGTIWVESSLGAGATFAFTLPQWQAAAPPLDERAVGR